MKTCKLRYIQLVEVLPDAWLNVNPLRLHEVYPVSPAIQLVPAYILARVCIFQELWEDDAAPEDISLFLRRLEKLGRDVFIQI